MLPQSNSVSSTLDYFRSSPVRGQLEPYDPRSTLKGWRYIQTTDTLNQLKVLLPPGTASMYEQLLKFEALELSKRSAISWERILEIRHLKDRMIRKCQKLAKALPARKPNDISPFQTFIAPPDFRVKEMEKWFQQQQIRTNALLRRSSAGHDRQAGAYCCSTCADRANMAKGTIPNRLHPSSSALSNHPPQLPPSQPNNDRRLSMYNEARPLPQHLRPPLAPREKLSTRAARSKMTAVSLNPQLTRSVSSPPPLPHLLRIRNLETGFDLSDDPQKIISPTPEAGSNGVDTSDSTSDDDGIPVTPPEQGNSTPQGELRRQRSCIKRSSIGDLVKTVSWADDRDLAEQVSRYASVAREAQDSGRKWEEIRDIYMEQIAGLEALHRQVEESLEHLRLETEHLKRADETIHHQKEKLRSTFQDFERKQMRFQAKVQEALEDADHVLSLSIAVGKDVSPKKS